MFKLKKGMDITGIYHDIIHESMMSKSIYIITLKDRTVFELIPKIKIQNIIKKIILLLMM